MEKLCTQAQDYLLVVVTIGERNGEARSMFVVSAPSIAFECLGQVLVTQCNKLHGACATGCTTGFSPSALCKESLLRPHPMGDSLRRCAEILSLYAELF
ncbi:MAG: hypothetical protein GXP29_10835 [Planctomycetes bacterium]|nr:hypothetical protein [Planctomycetota bacterium]